MKGPRAALIVLLGVTLGGCKSLMSAASPGNSACGDPCAAMVCPPGDHCLWDGNCHPRCEPTPMPNNFGH